MRHLLRHRTQQRTGDGALALGADDDHVAARALDHVHQRVRHIAHTHIGFISHPGRVEQCARRRHEMVTRLQAGGVDQVGVARGHQFVQRGGLLHVGQHHGGLEPLAHQRQCVVHAIQGEFGAVHGDEDFEHGVLLVVP